MMVGWKDIVSEGAEDTEGASEIVGASEGALDGVTSDRVRV